jgi:hypothetical protein
MIITLIVLTTADLVYDDTSKYLKVQDSNDGSDKPIPKYQNGHAAEITNSEDENDSLSTEDPDIINDVAEEEEDIASEKNPPTTIDDNRISDEI